MLKRGKNGSVAKKERVWLASAIKLAQVDKVCSRSLAVVHSGGKRQTHASGKTPDRFLQRRRLNQGRAYKCPLIRELLWDWFVDIRRSVSTTISPKFVLLKARSIADLILKHQRKTGSSRRCLSWTSIGFCAGSATRVLSSGGRTCASSAPSLCCC